MEPGRIIYSLRQTRGTGPMAVAALLLAVSIGSWWTTQAVVAGNLGLMLVRLGLSAIVGTFYFVLFRLCWR